MASSTAFKGEDKVNSENLRVSQVTGIKEGTFCMEHWVLYANNESWNTTSKTNDVMYGD